MGWHQLFERGLLPAFVARAASRRLTRRGLRKWYGLPVEKRAAYHALLRSRLGRAPIAVHTRRANEQHYELPPSFFAGILGPRMKYSCCHWPEGVKTLQAAEDSMLELTCERAGIRDGMELLDLGCGWGSLTLWIAERYPRCRVTAVSNSRLQGEHIREECGRSGITNVRVVTADVNDLQTGERFDRVVSIEMFEHVKNYAALMDRIAGFLKPDGKLFVHVFCHRELAFEYSQKGPNLWMAEHFFSGGNMPSRDLLLHFQRDLLLSRFWAVGGIHYARTLRAWLERFESNLRELAAVASAVYGEREAALWLNRWRLFFIICGENFGFRSGTEYFVAHYLFEKR